MRSILVTICVLLLCGRGAHAQDKRVTIPPAALSLPQLAKQLSTDGRTIVCASDLKECAAFVSLNQREWKQAIRLLGEGLAVRFVPVANAINTWRMERDPAVLARENRFRKQWFRNLEDEFERDYGILSRYSLRDYPRIAAQEKHLNQIEREYIHSRPPMGSLESYNDPVYKELRRQRLDIGKLYPGSPEIWLAAALYRSGKLGTVEQSFQRRETVAVINMRELDGLFGGVPPPEYKLNPAFPAVIARVQTGFRDRAETHITVSHPDPAKVASDTVGRLRFDAQYSLQTLFLGEKRADYLSVRSLGKEAETWFQKECKLMEGFLKSPRAEGVIRSKANTPFAAISTLIEGWCRSQDAEAIMELDPVHEEISQATLGYNHDRPTPVGTRREDSPDLEGEPKPAPRHNLPSHPLWDHEVPQGVTLRLVFQDNLIGDYGRWTLRDQNDVLLVTNRLAFLSRPHPYPLASFLRLEARWNQHQQSGGTEYNIPEEVIEDYVSSVTQEQNRLWIRNLTLGSYRRVPMEDIAGSVPVLKLWRTLPAQKRRELLAPLTDVQAVSVVSAAESAPRALEELERNMRLYGDSNGYRAWLPDNLQTMRRGRLKIRVWGLEPSKDGGAGRAIHALHFESAREGVSAHSGAFILSAPKP